MKEGGGGGVFHKGGKHLQGHLLLLLLVHSLCQLRRAFRFKCKDGGVVDLQTVNVMN